MKLLTAVGIPLLLALVAALAFAYIVSAGFAGEGCRFAGAAASSDGVPRLADWALLHALFLVAFALPVAGIVHLLGATRVGGWQVGRLVTALGIATFTAAAFDNLSFMLTCGGSGPLRVAGRLTGLATPWLALAFLFAALGGWLASFNAPGRDAP